MIKQISIKTRVGWISDYENKGKIFQIKFGRVKKQINSKVLKKFARDLSYFFKRKTNIIYAPHKMEGNLIQKKVWGDLRKIKPGQTKSYGMIAKKYKLSPRHVGKICSQNKLLLLVPCHRVINNNGNIGGFTSVGGIKLKKKLLEFEKIN